MNPEKHSAADLPTFAFPPRTDDANDTGSIPPMPFADTLDPGKEKRKNPFFAGENDSQILLESGKPGNTSRRLSLRFLSFGIKFALLCLLAAIGWYSYQEYVTHSEQRTIEALREARASAKQRVAEARAKAFIQPTNKKQAAANGKSVASNKASAQSRPKVVAASDKVVPAKKANSLSMDFKTSPVDASLAKRKKKEEAELRSRLKKSPLDPDLLIALADNLTAQKRKDSAWLLLAKSARTGDKRFASRILALGLETGKHDESLMIVEPESKDAPEWDKSDWVNIALLHEKSGNPRHALKLLKLHDKGNKNIARITKKQEQQSKSASLR